MDNILDLRDIRNEVIVPLSDKFYGKTKDGTELSINNYYIELDHIPFFGISGECHYSRVHESQWEDTILKMKMGGINIIATYVFWIHHEEEEGKFCFEGNKNIRKFIDLCKKHKMYVIIRIGPFDHGEVRNGGIPDWLYGKPFEVRSLNEGFLSCTRKLYGKLAKQLEGFYFKDGGPIIGTQIDNEYMHSAAPWELTTGVTNEWLPGGSDGIAYMKKLKSIAQEEGIITPFYTCTGWGGAAVPTDEMLPLWGGYAFWPWIYYDWSGDHPVTPEYIYRDYHNNKILKTYNFEPTYEPESFPYACCEMGGGMANYYHYRFQLPFESVDAMANIKLAGGCNFLGYYMYRGGSNPKGVKTPYLNECQCPKISYDYQAPIGEYGQLRPSYFRLKAFHLFVKNFQDKLCKTVTILPDNAQNISPEDTNSLRFAARIEGQSGFLFLNNYQDHIICKPKKEEKITLLLKEEEIEINHISLAEKEEAILPFHMQIEEFDLIYAKAQPLSYVTQKGRSVYFFFTPDGMEAEYVWNHKNIVSVDEKPVKGERISIIPPKGEMSSYIITGKESEVEIVTLTRMQSLQFYETESRGEKTAILSNCPILFDGNQVITELEDNQNFISILTCPEREIVLLENFEKASIISQNVFKGIIGNIPNWEENQKKTRILQPRQCGPSRFTIEIPHDYKEFKDAILQIEYRGDIGQAFINGCMISDNFCNEAVWEIGLKEVWKPEMGNEITLLITPLKNNVTVDVSSTMAGRMEKESEAIASLLSVHIKTLKEEIIMIK